MKFGSKLKLNNASPFRMDGVRAELVAQSLDEKQRRFQLAPYHENFFNFTRGGDGTGEIDKIVGIFVRRIAVYFFNFRADIDYFAKNIDSFRSFFQLPAETSDRLIADKKQDGMGIGQIILFMLNYSSALTVNSKRGKSNTSSPAAISALTVSLKSTLAYFL